MGPYEAAMTEAYLNTDKLKNGGLTSAQIKKATRGLSQSSDVPADTVTPTACIGPDVIFNDVRNTGSTTGIGDTVNNAKDLEAFGVALCDPNGRTGKRRRHCWYDGTTSAPCSLSYSKLRRQQEVVLWCSG